MKLMLKANLQKVDQSFFFEKLRTYLRYSVNFGMNIIQEKAYLLKPHLQTKARLT